MIGRIGPKRFEHTVAPPPQGEKTSMGEGSKKAGIISLKAIPKTYESDKKKHVFVELKGEENYPRRGKSSYPV